MASYFGINSSYNFFGTSSNNYYGSSGSSILSNYALIRSGAYKKLLNAYYGKGSSSSGTSNRMAGKTTELADNQEKINLKTVQTSAEELQTSAAALKRSKLYEGKINGETGEMEYDKEGIKKQVTSFIDSYNKTIDAAGNADTLSVLRKTVWMINDVKANNKLLGNVGITIGEDNKLALNGEKFGEAKMSTLKILFSGSGSLADKVMSKASELGKLSGAAMNTLTKRAVSYSSTGDYKTLSASSLYDSFF